VGNEPRELNRRRYVQDAEAIAKESNPKPMVWAVLLLFVLVLRLFYPKELSIESILELARLLLR